MAKLYMMIGIPGSGKSTYAKQIKNAVHISRDEIRFSIITPEDDYFSKETQVFEEFCKQINTELAFGKNVIADATHLNRSSRNKLLRNIKGYDELVAIVLNTHYTQALEQNENRAGTRSYVPRDVIRRMAMQLTIPDKEIEPKFQHIYIVNNNKIIELD